MRKATSIQVPSGGLTRIAAVLVAALCCLSAAASTNDNGIVSHLFGDHIATMLLIDPDDGWILDANRQAEMFYGISLGELRTMRIDQINLYPKEEVAELLRQAQLGERHAFVFPHRTRHQGIRSVAVYSSPVLLPSGQSALLSIVHDLNDPLIPEHDARICWQDLERLLDQASGELLAQREQQIRLQRGLMAVFLAVFIVVLVGYRGRAKALADLKSTAFEAEKLGVAVDQSPASIVITSCDGQIEYVNQTCVQNSGYSREELLGQNPRKMQSGKTPRETYTDLWATISSGKTWEGRLINRRKDGSEYTEWAMIRPVLDQQGRPIRFIAVKDDITERERLAERLKSLERYDPLTGIANRFAFFEALEERLRLLGDRQSQQPLALINIDRFNSLNDLHGHDTGDRALQIMAQRLLTSAPAEALVARLGSDEFAVLPSLESIPKSSPVVPDSLRWVHRIQRVVNEPFTLDNQTLSLGASIGVAYCSSPSTEQEGHRPGDIMRMADWALKTAKAKGGRQMAFFDAQASEQAQEALRLDQDLERAIERDQLWVALQAQVRLDGSLGGVEVLLRWRHDVLGQISPCRFIPMAEENGQIIPIGRWVLQRALTILKRLQDRDPSISLSVNISPVQIRNPQFLTDVRHLLEGAGVDPKGLVLEITESVFLADPEMARSRLKALRELGVGISIDDFGTGYSSLSYLKRLPVTELKIDQSFVRGLPHDPDDIALVRVILAAARQLNLRVVVEGVETAEQAEFFAGTSDVMLQGYLFDRPIEVDAWSERWMTEVGVQ